ncbi:Response regulator [Chitinispirillum alkaliphilum]|nr:Response regulator [Chitinispirillum alkaliphilum]
MTVSRKKVLWVDDEIEFLRAHILFLETRGYSVFPVFSGDDAVQLIKENGDDYDIVLLDEQMPGKDGLTTLEEIKEIAPSLPVVMVTKSEEEEVMEAALGLKIDGYLTKPVNPSQVLLVCKRLLDCNQLISKQLKEKYLRSYTEIRSRFSAALNVAAFARIFDTLSKWSIELADVEDEGLRQMHAGLISDCNTLFCDLVSEQYPRWIKGKGGRSAMATDVLEKIVVPRIGQGEKTVMVVLSGMRIDQFMDIEPELRKIFKIDKKLFCSVLPSDLRYSRASLFTGMYPDKIHKLMPDVFEADEKVLAEKGKELLLLGLEKFGIGEDDIFYEDVAKGYTLEDIKKVVDISEKTPLTVIAIDIVKQFMSMRSAGTMLKEIASDEKALRSFTTSWFNTSSVLQLLKSLSNAGRSVIITSDHGHILCSRGTEVYGVDNIGQNLRCLFDQKISADERRVVFLQEPAHYGLPNFSPETRCVIARENYYFIYPEEFENYREQYLNSFQCGGISMDEMIMPLYICKSR